MGTLVVLCVKVVGPPTGVSCLGERWMSQGVPRRVVQRDVEGAPS
jgi:hypothetical protein